MATRTITSLVDDTDGSEATETIAFGVDNVAYEIDLSDKNAKDMRDALAPWVSAARKTGGRRTSRREGGGKEDLKAVRAWAASNKIKLSSRGRIPRTVIDQYHAAGN